MLDLSLAVIRCISLGWPGMQCTWLGIFWHSTLNKYGCHIPHICILLPASLCVSFGVLFYLGFADILEIDTLPTHPVHLFQKARHLLSLCVLSQYWHLFLLIICELLMFWLLCLMCFIISNSLLSLILISFPFWALCALTLFIHTCTHSVVMSIVFVTILVLLLSWLSSSFTPFIKVLLITYYTPCSCTYLLLFLNVLVLILAATAGLLLLPGGPAVCVIAWMSAFVSMWLLT